MNHTPSVIAPGISLPKSQETLTKAAIGIDQQVYRLPELGPILEILDQVMTPPFSSQDQLDRLGCFHRIAVDLGELTGHIEIRDEPSIAATIAWIEREHGPLYRLYYGKEVPRHEAEHASKFLFVWRQLLSDSEDL